MLLMIDNYDSFTYNLVQYFGELGQEVRVFRNDEITLDGIGGLKPDYLVLSPGPCSPAECLALPADYVRGEALATTAAALNKLRDATPCRYP